MKIGRTHLQDAVPIRLGQELSGYAGGRERGRAARGRQARLAELALGGTAVGTGLNAPPGFADRVIEGSAKATRLPSAGARPLRGAGRAGRRGRGVRRAEDDRHHFEQDRERPALDGVGTTPGLGEITCRACSPAAHHARKSEPGDLRIGAQVAAQVIGNDAAITIAGTVLAATSSSTMMPLIAYDLLESIEILARAAAAFDRDCVAASPPTRSDARAGRALARDGDRAGAEDRLRRGGGAGEGGDGERRTGAKWRSSEGAAARGARRNPGSVEDDRRRIVGGGQ